MFSLLDPLLQTLEINIPKDLEIVCSVFIICNLLFTFMFSFFSGFWGKAWIYVFSCSRRTKSK